MRTFAFALLLTMLAAPAGWSQEEPPPGDRPPRPEGERVEGGDRPPGPPPREGDRGPEGRGPREGERRPEGRPFPPGPPREGDRGPEGRGPRDGERGPEGRGPEGRPFPPGPPRDGDRGPEGRGPRDGERGPEGRGPEGRPFPPGPPREGDRGPDGRPGMGRGPEGRGPMGPPVDDRELRELSEKDRQLEAESMELAERLRRGGEDLDRNAVKEKLAGLVREHFTVRQARRKRELTLMQERLNDLKASIESRDQKAEELIQRRLGELSGEGADLSF